MSRTRAVFEAVGVATIVAGAWVALGHARRWMVWRVEARRHRCPHDGARRPPARQPDGLVTEAIATGDAARPALDWACQCGRTHRFDPQTVTYLGDVPRPAAPTTALSRGDER